MQAAVVHPHTGRPKENKPGVEVRLLIPTNGLQLMQMRIAPASSARLTFGFLSLDKCNIPAPWQLECLERTDCIGEVGRASLIRNTRN